jgi:hypothetical protein
MPRSNLPREEAKRRYVDAGELAVLEQIRLDSGLLDARSIAVGPFARVDAGVVAAADGKTRGAITNLFGSQAAFQAETMELALSAGDWIEQLSYPAPEDFPDADAWIDAFFSGEAARGPQHGADPAVDYGFLWALWLSAVPYGLWSDRVVEPSLEEHELWLARLQREFTHALEHFGLELRAEVTVGDLASAVASLIEGVWLNQCLTTRHPLDSSEPIATAMRRSGRLVWLGAVSP